MVRTVLLVVATSCACLTAPARADDASARGGAPRVIIVAPPWGAPFAPDALARALRLRLPGAEVSVAGAAEPEGPSERWIAVRWLDGPPALRLERGSGDAIELPVEARARGGPERAARRAALLVALFAEQAPLAGVRVEEPEPDRSPAAPPPSLAVPAPLAAPAAPAPVDEQVRAPAIAPPPPSGDAPPSAWALDAALGPTAAVEDDEIKWTSALTVRARRRFAPRAALELGGKLSGAFSAREGGQRLGVADRVLFAGVAYEGPLWRRGAVELGAALQYAHPAADVDGAGPIRRLDAPGATRLALRTSAGLRWSPDGRLFVGVTAATAFSFQEREYTDGDGREVLGVGFMTLDLAAGAGVRW